MEFDKPFGEDTRYFIKGYYVDPEDTVDGVITKSTPLYPYYAANRPEYAHYLNADTSAVSKGTGRGRTIEYAADSNTGFDKWHGASGNAYIKDRMHAVDRPHGKNSFYDNTAYTVHMSGDKPNKYDDQLGLLEQLNAMFMYDTYPTLSDKDAAAGRLPGTGNVAVVVAAPEKDIVSFNDVYKGDWDAWRDSAHEVQTKYIMPLAQIRRDNYITDTGIDYDMAREVLTPELIEAINREDYEDTDTVDEIFDKFGLSRLQRAVLRNYGGNLPLYNENKRNSMLKVLTGPGGMLRYAFDLQKLLDDNIPYDSKYTLSDGICKMVWKDISKDYERMRNGPVILNALAGRI